MKSFIHARSHEQPAEINIGPLLDMVFILLIFFVITTNFNRQTGIDVNKPKAATAISVSTKTVLIGISREGGIHIHGKQVSSAVLEEILRRELNKQPELNAVIVADRLSPLGKSIEVLDICNRIGIRNASVAAEKEQ